MGEDSFAHFATLVCASVAVLSAFIIVPWSAFVLAAVNPFLGAVVPLVGLCCTGGFVVCCYLRPESDEGYADESARRSPVRSGAADPDPPPQLFGNDDIVAEKWQVQAGPGGSWIDFDASVSLEISDAVASGLSAFSFDLRGHSYEINLLEMTQKNAATGKVRSIRRAGNV
ncbi:unnamed protein product [Effrenium voratum]|nr:unnamed protein product [Effrenium voratum]